MCSSFCMHVNRRVRRIVVMVFSSDTENGDKDTDQDEEEDEDAEEVGAEDTERLAQDRDEEGENGSPLSEQSRCNSS